jgi:hypothetical protein
MMPVSTTMTLANRSVRRCPQGSDFDPAQNPPNHRGNPRSETREPYPQPSPIASGVTVCLIFTRFIFYLHEFRCHAKPIATATAAKAASAARLPVALPIAVRASASRTISKMAGWHVTQHRPGSSRRAAGETGSLIRVVVLLNHRCARELHPCWSRAVRIQQRT